METVLQDIRYALRMMRKSPGFTAMAVLTLALGIGANTAIFSLVNAVLLRSLPYPEPDRLVKIAANNPGVGLREVPLSYPEFDDIRSRAGVFQDVTVVWPSSGNLTGSKQPERLELLAVSPNYFSMLGAVPQVGRLFGQQDVAAGFAQAAVISDGLWRRGFGADPNILRHNLELDNDPYTIVGVLPPGFRHPGRTVAADVEVWITAGFRADPFSPDRGQREIVGLMGRLKPGLSLDQAQARLDTLAAAVRKDFPTDYPAQANWSIQIQPLQASLVGDVRPMLLVLMGAVILIVVLASVNLANLLLARASGRQQEMAVRMSLGATRIRMIRQMLTESVILSCFGGLAGVISATVALRFILQLVPSGVPRLTEVSVNWAVLLFALLISILTGILFGLAPALQSANADLVTATREGARGASYSTKTSRLRGLLIGSELALAMVLMVGAGLLLRTFWGLLQENPGFNPSHVVTARIWLPVPNDPKADPYSGPEKQNPFIRESLRRLSAIPGVELAAFSSSLPASLARINGTALMIEDRPSESSQDLRGEVIRISPDYFKVMQTPLVRGRFFAESDEKGKEEVAIIDESTAHRYWPTQDAVGRRLRLGRAASLPWISVVGVVKDIKHDGLDTDGVPHIYRSVYQHGGRALNVVLRTPLPASALDPQIRREIQAVDPGLPVFGVRSMTEVVDASLAPRRFSATLVTLFAVLALALACVGVYGLLAYMVRQRSHEIGIRMALGASAGNIRDLFLRKGIVLSAAGIGVGLLLAALAAPAIASLLYGVRPIDAEVFLTVPAALLAVAALASYVPARRATKVDPMVALRES